MNWGGGFLFSPGVRVFVCIESGGGMALVRRRGVEGNVHLRRHAEAPLALQRCELQRTFHD